jgi:hypothetical protein
LQQNTSRLRCKVRFNDVKVKIAVCSWSEMKHANVVDEMLCQIKGCVHVFIAVTCVIIPVKLNLTITELSSVCLIRPISIKMTVAAAAAIYSGHRQGTLQYGKNNRN